MSQPSDDTIKRAAPVLTPRASGGWLAVGAVGDSRIGAEGETEDAARRAFEVAQSAWTRLLAEAECVEARAALAGEEKTGDK